MINMKYEKRKEHYERRKHAGAGKAPQLSFSAILRSFN